MQRVLYFKRGWLTMGQVPAQLLLLMQDPCRNRAAGPPGLILPCLVQQPKFLNLKKKKKKRHRNRPKQEQQENLCKHFLLILWVRTLFFILCLEEDVNPEAPAEGTWYLLTPQVRQPSSCPTARGELLPARHPCSSSTYLKQAMPSLSLRRIISNANLKECRLI